MKERKKKWWYELRWTIVIPLLILPVQFKNKYTDNTKEWEGDYVRKLILHIQIAEIKIFLLNVPRKSLFYFSNSNYTMKITYIFIVN